MINVGDRLKIDDVDKTIINYFNILFEEYIELLERLNEEDFLDINVSSLDEFPENQNDGKFFVLKNDIKTNEKNYYKGDYFVRKNGKWNLIPAITILYSTSDFFFSRKIKNIHQRKLPTLFLKRNGINRIGASVGVKDTILSRVNKYNALKPFLRPPSIKYVSDIEQESKVLRTNPPIMMEFLFECEFISRKMSESENLIWFLNQVDKRGWGFFEGDNIENEGSILVNISDNYSSEISSAENEERYISTTFSLSVKYYITSNVTELEEITNVETNISYN